jgi:hypothetical protein
LERARPSPKPHHQGVWIATHADAVYAIIASRYEGTSISGIVMRSAATMCNRGSFDLVCALLQSQQLKIVVEQQSAKGRTREGKALPETLPPV